MKRKKNGKKENGYNCMINFCKSAIEELAQLKGESFALKYCELRCGFFKKYSNGLLTSTSHGLDFFENILTYKDKPKSWFNQFPKETQEFPISEYEKNFVKILQINP